MPVQRSTLYVIPLLPHLHRHITLAMPFEHRIPVDHEFNKAQSLKGSTSVMSTNEGAVGRRSHLLLEPYLT